MSTFADRMYANARITPIQRQRQVKGIEKLADGSLRVLNHGGETYDIPADAIELQAFVVYTVLQDAARA